MCGVDHKSQDENTARERRRVRPTVKEARMRVWKPSKKYYETGRIPKIMQAEGSNLHLEESVCMRPFQHAEQQPPLS